MPKEQRQLQRRMLQAMHWKTTVSSFGVVVDAVALAAAAAVVVEEEVMQ